MSSEPREIKAQRSLGEQIEQLKALRTSNVRDTEFKQWRQTTLTIIQRIWVGDGQRSTRFRRIPFSPPSSQANLRETREYYERGCAEAGQLLQGFLDEIAAHGMPAASHEARPASLDPGVAEDHFPTLDLPLGAAPHATPPAAAGDAGEARPGAVSVRGEQAGVGPRRSAPDRRRKQTKNGPRRRLRDMLGLDALERLGKSHDPLAGSRESGDVPAGEDPVAESIDAPPAPAQRVGAQTTPVAPAEREPEVHEAPREREPEAHAAPAERKPEVHEAPREREPEVHEAPREREPEVHEAPRERELEAHAAPRERELEAHEAPRERELEAHEAPADAVDEQAEAGVPFTADEFLSASPIFKTEGKPVTRSRPEVPVPAPIEGDLGPAPLTSSTAIAIAAIAAEVARLGVPEGQRAGTRATLVNLAQLVEDGVLDWEGLRTAVAFAMEYPPVGRRLLPLLIPFLDQAA